MTTLEPFGNVTMTSWESEEEHRIKVITNIVLASIIGVCCVLGLIGNSLVVIIWAMSRKLQTITNIFIVSLSITDFLGCSMLPIQMYTFLDFDDGNPVPGWVCRMCGALCLIAFKSSVTHLALISINRYVVITRFRAHYLRMYSVRNVVFMVLFAWIFPVLLIMLPPSVGLGRLGYNAANQLCVFDGTPIQLRIIYIFEEILFGLSFFIIVGCYLRIYLYVSRQHRDLIHIYSKRENSAAALEIPSQILEDSIAKEIETSTTSSAIEIDPDSHSRSDLRHPNTQLGSTHKDSVYSIRVQKSGKKRTRTRSSEAMRTVLTKREIDITKNLFAVVCCFFFFVFPHIMCLTSSGCYTTFFKYTATALVLNSCTNPFIYCLKHPTFREVSSCLFRGNLSQIPHPANWLKRLLNRWGHCA